MEKIITSIAGGAMTAVLTWIARYHDPIYSDGWFLNNLEWLFIPAIVALAAIAVSLRTSGFWALVGLIIVMAGVFAWLYHRSDQSDPWPIVTWILHLVVASLFAGAFAGVARFFYIWWRGLPPSP